MGALHGDSSGGLKNSASTLAKIELAGRPEIPQYDAVAFLSQPSRPVKLP